MADNASTHTTVSSMGDTDNDSGMVPEDEQRSLWREKVENRLRITKEVLQRETDGFQILKVPEFYRQPPETFTPVGWRYGLHNLGSVDKRSGSEALKHCGPIIFGLDEEQKWVHFCEYVVPDTERMLTCYGLQEEDIELSKEEIMQLLAFDALFIAMNMEIFESFRGERKLWCTPPSKFSRVEERNFNSTYDMCPRMEIDLFKIENQIPFELIKRAIEYIVKLTRPSCNLDSLLDQRISTSMGQLDVPYLEEWMKEAVTRVMRDFVSVNDDTYVSVNSDLRLSESHHILDALYKVTCGKEGLQRKSDTTPMEYIRIPSASKLKLAGVRIKGVAKPLYTMSYNKRTKSLILPKMKLYDETITFICNMAQYEARSENSMFHDYIFLLYDLIDTHEDMEHLIKCGVIHNNCGSRAFGVWESMDQYLMLKSSSKEHNAMKEDILRRYNQKLPKLWREFRTLFCSRPWLIVPIIAATLVTIATLIQTYAAVIGSDRMMPRYKNP